MSRMDRPTVSPILSAELSVQTNQRRILGPIQLFFQKGRTAIIGPNGSGKSTLLHALAGVLPAGIEVEGELRYQGKILQHMSPAERASNIAWLAQDAQASQGAGHNSFQTTLLTVQGLIELASLARLGWMSQIDEPTRVLIEAAVETFDLLALRNQALQQLSGGELQRAQLARVFAVGSTVLLLDEPDNHLDLKHLSSLEQAMANSRADCIIYSTHDLNFALKADHLILMKQGIISQQIDLVDSTDQALEASLSACFETKVRLLKNGQVRSAIRA